MEPLSVIRFQPTPKLGSSNYNNHLLSNTNFIQSFGVVVKSFAKKSSKKIPSRTKKSCGIVSDRSPPPPPPPPSGDDLSSQNVRVSVNDNTISAATCRSVVLQACTVTSGLILALGFLVRQGSHIAFTEGLPVIDSSTEVSFNFEMWHIELIIGLVILISSCRYLLLQTWADFAESSEAANRQVLSSLQPLDYMIVAFLPGFSEELLFRGALLPLFGLNWRSALVVAVIFGALHLGSGRRYSFAIWATFVGFAYGYATILSSSIIVPIASHALNNLIGGILWLYTSNDLARDTSIPTDQMEL